MSNIWAKKSIKSRYIVKNRSKYMGDPAKVTARSTWERAAFIFLDNNPRVKKWGSEIVKIPYVSSLDKKTHTYIIDLIVQWMDGVVEIIEIKPKYQTVAPKKKSRTTKKYINEAAEYIRNHSKWTYAEKFAKSKGWNFVIWDEVIMKNKGIAII